VATVRIEDVPEEVLHVMERRAAKSGQTLEEYLLAWLVREAEEATFEELLERTRG
jgi:hypothetical protein